MYFRNVVRRILKLQNCGRARREGQQERKIFFKKKTLPSFPQRGSFFRSPTQTQTIYIQKKVDMPFAPKKGFLHF